MLPAQNPTSDSTSSPNIPSSHSSTPPTQHGFHVHDSSHNLELLRHEADTKVPDDAGDTSSEKSGTTALEHDLEPDLIIENDVHIHEFARQKRKSKKAKRDDPAYISRVPNEVLTHILSFLDATSLQSSTLINRRFHALVTSPHAWRTAFARYFPQHTGTGNQGTYTDSHRYFTRLTPKSSYRSEYILRTQLLRSLKRGRPQNTPGFRMNPTHNAPNFSMITYNPKLHESTVTNLAVDFNRNRVIAASAYSGLYSYSDMRTGHVEIEQRFHPGYGPLGLGHISREGLGALDVSENFGQIIGDASSNGFSFFVERTAGGPRRFMAHHGPEAYITAVWIAKKDTIVNTSGDTILSASGSSKGVVQFQGIKTSGVLSYVLCPGVPILDIQIDDNYTKSRERANKIWCVVVNALGEVWYLKGKLPMKSNSARIAGHRPQWHTIPETKVDKAPIGMDVDGDESGDDRKTAHERDALIMQWLSMSEEVMQINYSDNWGWDHFIQVDFSGQNIVHGRKGLEETEHEGARQPFVRKYGRYLDTGNTSEDETGASLIIDHATSSEGVIDPAKTVDTDNWSMTKFSIPHNTETNQLLITATAIDMSYVTLASKEEDRFHSLSSPGSFARLFAIGTSRGSVHVYNARQPASDSVYPPLRSIETDSPAISSLALSSLYLVHGGSDGLVQAWDPLASTTEPIRALHSKHSSKARRRLAQAAASVQGIGENQFAARSIVLDPHPTQLRGVVALGTQIRCWSFATDQSATSGKRSPQRRKNGRRGSNSSLNSTTNVNTRIRHSSKVVIKSDIAEEANLLTAEDEKLKAEDEYLLSRFGAGKTHLSEREMIMYAQMLSEESFHREQGSSPPLSAHMDDISSSFLSQSPDPGEGSSLSWHNQEDTMSTTSTGTQTTNHTSIPLIDQTVREAPMVLQNLDHDLELARALQESLVTSSSPAREIPIKYAKNKKKTIGTDIEIYSRTRNTTSFDKDVELALQLSLEEEQLRKAIERSQLE